MLLSSLLRLLLALKFVNLKALFNLVLPLSFSLLNLATFCNFEGFLWILLGSFH